MYGHLRDLFIEVLGYPARDVDIDRRGARGRPDLVAFAPGGTEGSRIAWIVLEAKDEKDSCAPVEARARLYREKSKYVTADTAWFVMAEPAAIIARPADRGSSDAADIVVPLAGLSIEEFAAAFAPLRAEIAGVPHMLDRFREGDESFIAVDRLDGSGDEVASAVARAVFYDSLVDTTRSLQSACERALTFTAPQRDAIIADVNAFGDEFGGVEFAPYPVGVQGKPKGYEQTQAHGRAAHRLTQRLGASPALARLALNALPRFAERTGIDPAKESAKLDRFFATETANLILARILLIRFLEDHGFFDIETPDGGIRRRYLCNGGVAAFQGMRGYFGHGYTRLLEDAYRSGAHVYAAAFNETELDWVLALADDDLSRAVEWAMYRFARFDFTTIRGDILTGIYDRFLDRRQRKAQGEFYTPPSIARYILNAVQLAPDDDVLDPSCGSGTFLIERYQQLVGEDADRGLATYADACRAVERLAGNDLNPFSAVLTQIQLLWHLLAFGPLVKTYGLPPLKIAERANSLVPTILKDQTATRFGDIDRSGYAAVVGNPPYIRPERGHDIDPAAIATYTEGVTRAGRSHPGISVDKNVYRLFIYRALDFWCSQPPQTELEEEAANKANVGRLGFVVPLNFCAADDAADLRSLFAVGGRWTIREIVDMEIIWKDVFDARVLPMILIAQARPATVDDRVTIRIADDNCVIRSDAPGRPRPTFDLTRAQASEVAYADIFTPQGRIATRLTPARLSIISKLRKVGELDSAAKRYWTRQRGGRAVVDERPRGVGEADWTERRLITDGVARRGRGVEGSADGLDLWKGENVRTGGFAGEPAFRRMDVNQLSARSVWAYPHILPQTMWALPILAQAPCAAPFNPSTAAVLNTVTVFGPRPDLEAFPFDALLSSRIYSWYCILALRSSYQDMLRGHLYPATIRHLPWSEELLPRTAELVEARSTFFAACRRRFEAASELKREADLLGLRPLAHVFRDLTRRTQAALVWSDEFGNGETFPFPLDPSEPVQEADGYRISLSAEGHSLVSPTEEIARLISAGLTLAVGSEVTRAKLLAFPIPPDAASAAAVRDLVARFQPNALEDEVEAEVDKIDRIVGEALGLLEEDVSFIQREMAEDSFLSRIRPRYPYFTPAQRGRRRSLETASRYG